MLRDDKNPQFMISYSFWKLIVFCLNNSCPTGPFKAHLFYLHFTVRLRFKSFILLMAKYLFKII